jgi:hypothetical protein
MRKKLRKRIEIFSVVVAFIFLILSMGVFAVFEIGQPYFSEMKDFNTNAMKQIECKGDVCDISKFINNPSYEGADYVLKRSKNELYFIQLSNDFPGFCLNYSDPNFLGKFRIPTTYHPPINAQWRLYSQNKKIGNRNIEIMVGLEEKAPERVFEITASPEIDQKLKVELDNIAKALKVERGKVILPTDFRTRIDGYQIVISETKEVISWFWNLPAFFPKDKPLPQKGLSIFRKSEKLFLVRTDYSNDLIVASLRPFGNLWLLGICAIAVYVLAFLLSCLISLTFFKKYFMLSHKHRISVGDALKSGEGQKIEFKRGLVDEDILKTITAFANTNDGTIFIGIDDDGKIAGIHAKTPKEKDNFRTKILNLIRNKVKPYILADIEFEEIREFIVVKIFIPRGEEFLYYLDGIIYARDGNADRKAPPEIVKKIISEYTR